MLELRWVDANRIDFPLGWKNGQVHRRCNAHHPGRSIFTEQARKIDIVLIDEMMKDRAKILRNGLEDDRATVRTEISFAGQTGDVTWRMFVR